MKKETEMGTRKNSKNWKKHRFTITLIHVTHEYSIYRNSIYK